MRTKVLCRLLLRPILVLFFGLLAAAPPLAAQETPAGIFSVNQELLFNQSMFGLRVRRELEERSLAVLSENQRIEGELKAEEKKLTEMRPELEPAEFRKLADEFDAKVETIRKEQAGKSNDLSVYSESEQNRFFSLATPVLVTIAKELNALAIIDSRSVIIASDQFDITNFAIARIDSVVGDGTETQGEAVDETPEDTPAPDSEETLKNP